MDQQTTEFHYRDKVYCLGMQLVETIKSTNLNAAKQLQGWLYQEMPPSHIADNPYRKRHHVLHDFIQNKPDEPYAALKQQNHRLARIETAYDRNQWVVFCELFLTYWKALKNENHLLLVDFLFPFLNLSDHILSGIYDISSSHDKKALWRFIHESQQLIFSQDLSQLISINSPSQLLVWWEQSPSSTSASIAIMLSAQLAKKVQPIHFIKWVELILHINQPVSHFKPAANCELLKDHCRTLAEIRREYIIQKDPIIAQQVASQQIINLLHEFVDNIVKLLGEEPCDFAFCVLGSSSRQDRRPYSDVELVLLYLPHTKQKLAQVQAYIFHLISGIELAIKNLGETHIEFIHDKKLQNAGFHIDSRASSTCFSRR